jgi:hypothetical protein
MARVRSPRYPSMSLEDAVEHGRTIFEKDRRHPIAREVAAGHIGYKSLNGAADSALSTLMQYGVLEKVAKGEVRVSQLVVDILFPDNPEQRAEAIRIVASNPPLFKALDDRFPEAIPSNETLRSYLTRENFNTRAIGPIVTAYTKTRAFVEREAANDLSVPRPSDQSKDGELNNGDDAKGANTKFGGAKVGDLVQWEIDGVLQIEAPRRVRLVQEVEGTEFIAVEGSETGIPMSQVTVLDRAEAPPAALPKFAIETPKPTLDDATALPEGWKEERLIDDGGEEIFIRYLGDPTPERYTFIRDYLDFKLGRMKK